MPRHLPSLPSLSATLVAMTALLVPLAAQGQRNVLPPGARTNAVPKAGIDSIVTTDMNFLTPLQLVESLLGPGVTASNIVLNGAPIAAGTFQGGLPVVGLDTGIVLSSGDIGSVVGPNAADWTSTDNAGNGDPDLDLLTTSPTYDATTLEFDFVCQTGGVITFQYVFSSEEYNEFVNTQFNDVFGFFLNGANIATLPSGTAVAINNVNCGNPYGTGGANCSLYLNNSCADLPIGAFPCTGPYDTEMDGLTVVLTATGVLLPGTNHIKLAIADAGDNVYDSNVFIRGQSFSCGGGGAYFVSPTPCGQTLQALVGLPVTFQVAASAATGLPSNAVTLAAGTLPSGVQLTPALPLSATGQNITVTTTVTWTPTTAQIGLHTLPFTATDQLSQVANCSVNVNVQPVGSGNATATVVGVGCTPSGEYAELRASDPPVLGTTIDLEVRHALPNWYVFHMTSFGPPVQIPLWSWCTAYVDLGNMLWMSTDVTNALGRSNTPFVIPSNPGLIGFDLTVQGVFLFTPDAVGIRATDGLYLVLGN